MSKIVCSEMHPLTFRIRRPVASMLGITTDRDPCTYLSLDLRYASCPGPKRSGLETEQ